MSKVNVSQICKIFNGSCFIKEVVGDDQLLMKCMIKNMFYVALMHFVRNSRYIMVDLYQTKLVTRKGASDSKSQKEEAKKSTKMDMKMSYCL